MIVKNITEHGYCAMTTVSDAEGGKYAAYAEPLPFMAYSYPTGDKGGFLSRGIEDRHTRRLLTNCNSIVFKKGDGICVSSADMPDYKITEVEHYSGHFELELVEVV